ncbi:MAG: sugar ABC transporter permease [Clostridiales bacterium]|jgi:arabinosaccharide transport system permease protein|nr:sugar ABC transporter permease [Clostridiales bacterium]
MTARPSGAGMAKKIARGFFYSPKVAPYVLVLPFLISFLVFFFYPLISTVQMSFQNIAGFDEVRFIGLQNYANLLNDRFFSAIRVTFLYTFWTILILVPLPLFLAVLLNSKRKIGAGFFKAAYFIPQLTSVIVAGIFFRFAFSDSATALINTIVAAFGGEPVQWLKKSVPTMAVLVTLCVWRWLGVNIVYFLAGLQNISPELYESASMDGASAARKFLHITLPGVKPTIVYVITISVYGGFSMFAESYALFGTARTPGEIGSTMVGYIYQQAFVEARLGFGAAAGMALLLLVLLINVVQLKFFNAFETEA